MNVLSTNINHLFETIDTLARELPRGFRRYWIAKAIRSDEELDHVFERCERLQIWLRRLDSEKMESLIHSWPLKERDHRLEILCNQISDAVVSRRECLFLAKTLHRAGKHWADALMHALSEAPEVLRRLQKKPGGTTASLFRIKEAQASPMGGEFEALVPPLTSNDLRDLRRGIDRYRKRVVRESKILVYRGVDLSDLAQFVGTEEEMPSDRITNNEFVAKALDRLQAVEREIVLFRYGRGRTLAEIGALVNLSTATVARYLDRSLDALRAMYVESDVGSAEIE